MVVLESIAKEKENSNLALSVDIQSQRNELKIKEEEITLNENIVKAKESELVVREMDIVSQMEDLIRKEKALNDEENAWRKRVEQFSKSIAAQEERKKSLIEATSNVDREEFSFADIDDCTKEEFFSTASPNIGTDNTQEDFKGHVSSKDNNLCTESPVVASATTEDEEKGDDPYDEETSNISTGMMRQGYQGNSDSKLEGITSYTESPNILLDMKQEEFQGDNGSFKGANSCTESLAASAYKVQEEYHDSNRIMEETSGTESANIATDNRNEKEISWREVQHIVTDIIQKVCEDLVLPDKGGNFMHQFIEHRS